MKIPLEHSIELGKGNYPLRTEYSNLLEPFQRDLLHRYGYWLEALAEGRIEAYTDAQTEFIGVTKKVMRPQSKFELVWMKLMKLREPNVTTRECDKCGKLMLFEPGNCICDECFHTEMNDGKPVKAHPPMERRFVKDNWDYSAIK